jgi:hypothetical protein
MTLLPSTHSTTRAAHTAQSTRIKTHMGCPRVGRVAGEWRSSKTTIMIQPTSSLVRPATWMMRQGQQGQGGQTLPHPFARAVLLSIFASTCTHASPRAPPPPRPLPLRKLRAARELCWSSQAGKLLPGQMGQWAIAASAGPRCRWPGQARSTALMGAISEPAPLCETGDCARGPGEGEETRQERGPARRRG